ncbi:MAG: alcohol dehydrogenase catalytic domain-containing protein [Myxococcota bacterium]
MRGVRHTENGIEVVEVPNPTGEGVRVKIKAIGICQTDLNLIKFGPLQFTMGHEFAGELDDGTPVGVQPTMPCGICDQCRHGETAWCAEGYQRLLGIGQDGGMADEIIVPSTSIVPLPRGLDAASGANLIEPLAINLHSLDLARFEGRMRTLVVGANISGFGLLAAAAALAKGAATVDVDASRSFQREAAARLGAGVEPSGQYDLVIEADGSEESIHAACEWCRPGGTLLLVAGYYTPKTWNFTTAFVKELTVIFGAFYGHSSTGRDVDAAATLLGRNPEIARILNTHRFPLEAAAEAFAFAGSDSESLKVVIEP